MAEQEKTTTKRKVPVFLRRDWHKKIKLGRGIKKKQKWKKAKGTQNKIRLGNRGYGPKPKIGYSQPSNIKGDINQEKFVKIETLKQLEIVKKGEAIIIAGIGARKRKLIIEESNKKGIKILNRYTKAKEKKE